MTLSAIYILPHGAMVLDPMDKDSTAVQNAMKEVAEEIDKSDARIILSTPHGIAASHDFSVYMNSRGSGSAEWEGKYSEYSIEVNFDTEFATKFVSHMEVNNSISGITAHNPNISIPLRWGEVIPLIYLKTLKKRKITILSQPTRRYNEAVEMVTEMNRLGRNLARFINQLDEDCIIIVSGDLAHTHDNKGPYGFSETAELFDQAFSDWVIGEELGFQKMIQYYPTALSCGFTSFAMIQGVFSIYDKFKRDLLINLHPSYYGMAVAKFTSFEEA